MLHTVRHTTYKYAMLHTSTPYYTQVRHAHTVRHTTYKYAMLQLMYSSALPLALAKYASSSLRVLEQAAPHALPYCIAY